MSLLLLESYATGAAEEIEKYAKAFALVLYAFVDECEFVFFFFFFCIAVTRAIGMLAYRSVDVISMYFFITIFFIFHVIVIKAMEMKN